MLRRFFSCLLWFLGIILKGALKVILTVFQFALGLLKIVLLLSGLVMRLFLAFVRADTPQR